MFYKFTSSALLKEKVWKYSLMTIKLQNLQMTIIKEILFNNHPIISACENIRIQRRKRTDQINSNQIQPIRGQNLIKVLDPWKYKCPFLSFTLFSLECLIINSSLLCVCVVICTLWFGQHCTNLSTYLVPCMYDLEAVYN